MLREQRTVVTIPTVEELGPALARVDGLLTAKRWERAAIVWAFTTNEDKGGQPSTGRNSGQYPMPVREFARLGFAGLRDRETVARYRAFWQTAVDSGDAKEVSPGDEVELPDLPWPPPAADQPIAGDPSWEEHPPAAPRPLSAKVAGVRRLERIFRLTGHGREDDRGGGLPLPALFAPILKAVNEHGPQTVEQLTKAVKAGFLGGKEKRLAYMYRTEDPWPRFMNDGIDQLIEANLLAADGDRWIAGENFKPDTRLVVIDNPRNTVTVLSPEVDARGDAELEANAEAAWQRRELVIGTDDLPEQATRDRYPAPPRQERMTDSYLRRVNEVHATASQLRGEMCGSRFKQNRRAIAKQCLFKLQWAREALSAVIDELDQQLSPKDVQDLLDDPHGQDHSNEQGETHV
jgi:hypothetical protein